MKLWCALILSTLTFVIIPATRAAAAFPEVKDLPVRTEMPDVMTMLDGTKVTTAAQWQTRREEMKQILEFYELGHAPPPPGNVSGRDRQSHPVLAGAASYRLVHLSFGPGESLGLDFNQPVNPETAARSFTNLLNRGYAIVTYRYTQCGEDSTNYRSSSFYPAYPGYDWGVLFGWAWGLSRVVDYVGTQPFADKDRLIALGHSRLGKLVMVATAFDDRIALGAPAGSSGAGTGAYRFCGPGRGGKEGIEDMTRKFGYYFVPRLKDFTGQMDKLPFEAYWYIALTAPRPWISVEGTDDQNCVPNAVRQSVLAARPVYQFLGVSADRVGVNYEPHRHALTAGDWTAALDFADQQLRGMDHHRTFDQFPP